MSVLLLFLPLIISGILGINLRIVAIQKISVVLIPIIASFIALQIDIDHTIYHHVLGIKFEKIGRSFVIFLNIMWCVTNIYVLGYKKQKKYTIAQFRKLTSLIALSVYWVQIVSVATNSIIVVFCYEMLTITTFFLVNFDKTPETYRGAKRYFKILMASSIGMLVPFIILFYISVNNYVYAKFIVENCKSLMLFLLVFGASKNAIFPLSSWLNAAMVAPIPVSSLLHAVAVVNTGIIVVLKFYVYIIGFGLPDDIIGHIIKIATVLTIYVPCFQALRSDDIKLILAYSTISQLGIIMFGMFSIPKNAQLSEIIISQLFAHGLAKIILFFIAGEFFYSRKTYNINSYDDMIKESPITVIIFILAALSIIGLPPFIGFYTKSNMIMSVTNHVDKMILLCSSCMSLLYFIKIFTRVGCKSHETYNFGKTTAVSITQMAIFVAFIMLIMVGYYHNEIMVFLWNQ